jgi:hypothetical protein
LSDATVSSYRRLPGRGRKSGFLHSIGGSCSLWHTDDHLLLVENNGITESYRRFYFKDIQAVVIQKTNFSRNFNYIAVSILFAAAIIYLSHVLGDGFPGSVLMVILFISLISLALNYFMGVTCICRIITPVQDEEIPSLKRLRNALKVKKVIDNACTALQGTLSEEDIMTRPVPVRQVAAQSDASNMLKPFIGRYHTLTFAIVLVQGLFLGLDISKHYALYNYIQIVLGSAVSILIIIALIKQHDSDAPAMTKTIMWTTIVFICLSTLIIFGVKMPYLMEQALVSQYDMYKSMANISPDDSDAVYWCYVISFLGYTVLGAAGLLYMTGRSAIKKEG